MTSRRRERRARSSGSPARRPVTHVVFSPDGGRSRRAETTGRSGCSTPVERGAQQLEPPRPSVLVSGWTSARTASGSSGVTRRRGARLGARPRRADRDRQGRGDAGALPTTSAVSTCTRRTGVPDGDGHARDPLREDRRRGPHRLSGRGRRTRRHGLRHGVGHEHRGDVGRPRLRAVPGSPRDVLPPDPVRQARGRPVGPGAGGPAPRHRDPHGRRARGDGCRRVGASRRLRRLRGRSDVDAVRRDLSRAHDRARPVRHGGRLHRPRARLQGGPRRVPRAHGGGVGDPRVRAARDRRLGRARSRVRRTVGRVARVVHAEGGEPRCGDRPRAHEPPDQRDPRARRRSTSPPS